VPKPSNTAIFTILIDECFMVISLLRLMNIGNLG